MIYNRQQRDMLITLMNESVINAPAHSETDKEIKRSIAPAMIDLAQDCNALEDQLNQALAVIDTLKDLVRTQARDRLDNLRGAGHG